MASRTQEQEQAADIAPDFPYAQYRNHPAWPMVQQAIAELVENGDLELQTPMRYVVGYLLQSLATEGIVPPAMAQASASKAATYRWVALYDLQGSAPKRKLHAARKK